MLIRLNDCFTSSLHSFAEAVFKSNVQPMSKLITAAEKVFRLIQSSQRPMKAISLFDASSFLDKRRQSCVVEFFEQYSTDWKRPDPTWLLILKSIKTSQAASRRSKTPFLFGICLRRKLSKRIQQRSAWKQQNSVKAIRQSTAFDCVRSTPSRLHQRPGNEPFLLLEDPIPTFVDLYPVCSNQLQTKKHLNSVYKLDSVLSHVRETSTSGHYVCFFRVK